MPFYPDTDVQEQSDDGIVVSPSMAHPVSLSVLPPFACRHTLTSVPAVASLPPPGEQAAAFMAGAAVDEHHALDLFWKRYNKVLLRDE